MNEKSLVVAKTLLPNNSMLALQNPFSSFVGLEIADATGGPNTGKPIIPTPIVDLHHSEQITVEKHVASKFLVYDSEAEENVSDNGEDIVRTTRKPGRPP